MRKPRTHSYIVTKAGKCHSRSMGNNHFEILHEVVFRKKFQIEFLKKYEGRLKTWMLAIIRCRIFCITVCHPKV
jgi:hypothetical protein